MYASPVYSLKATRERFDESRSKPPTLFHRQDFGIAVPTWLAKKRADQLHLLFKNRRQLYREGIVVWGALVQANSLLFDPKSPYSCPGEVVFSLDVDSNPEYLKDIAEMLYQLKEGFRGNEAEERIGVHLQNEMTRQYGLPVPSSVSDDLPCMLSTTFFERKLLPGKRLADRFFPIVASTTPPYLILPLPPKFWEQSLLEAWTTSPKGR